MNARGTLVVPGAEAGNHCSILMPPNPFFIQANKQTNIAKLNVR